LVKSLIFIRAGGCYTRGHKTIPFGTLPALLLVHPRLRLIRLYELLVPGRLAKDKIFTRVGRGQFVGPRLCSFKVWK